MSTFLHRAKIVFHLGLLLGLMFAIGTPVRAAGIGSAIPSKSYGAVVVTDPAKLNGKISGLMQALQLPVPELLPLVKFQLGFNNGFDEKRPALLILYPGKSQPVVPVFLVPTTKYADFQVNFAKREAHAKLKGYELVKTNVDEMLLAQRGEYAVMIPKEFEEDLDDFILDNVNLGEELAKSETWITEHDATFVATKKGIRSAMKFIRVQFNQAKAQFGNLNGADAEVYKMVFDGYDFVFKSLEEQGDLALIGAKLDSKNNVLINSHYGFDPKGSITEFLAKAGPAKSSDLGKLPAIPYIFAGDLQVAPEFSESLLQPFKALMQIGLKQQEKNLTEEQLKQYEAAVLKSVQGLRSGAFILGQAKPGESLLDNVIYTMQAENASKYLKNSIEQMSVMQKVLAESGQEITVKETKIGGKEALEFSQKGILEQLKKQNPANAREMNAIYSFIFGNRETLQQWIVVADQTTLVGSMNDALLLDTLRDLADKKSDFSKDVDNTVTLGLLPAERHVTMLIDFGGYMNLVMGMVKAAMPPGGGGNLPPDFPAAPSIGYSMKLSKEGIEVSTAVPFKLINAGSLYFQALIGNQGFNF
jgi:hypothetical protein